MWEKKRKLKERYDSTADFYDARYREIQRRKFKAVENELNEASCVLDIGCGTGLFLSENFNEGKTVVGLDFSGDMLFRAKERATDVFLVSADADCLPFLDGVFDVVFSFTLLQNMPEPERTIREMSRVTRQGGKVIVTALNKKVPADVLKNWMTSANLKTLRVGRIPESEDVLCVGRREE